MGSIAGPLRLLVNDRIAFHELLSDDIAWAVAQGQRCKGLMLALPWEDLMDRNLDDLRKNVLDIKPYGGQ